MKQQRALIDLKCILDTRLGVLARMNPLAANAVVRSEWYPMRDTDRFDKVSEGVIDHDEFVRLSKEHSVETLVNSVLTDFIYVLRSDVEEIFPQLDIKGIDGQIFFDINVYPFSLQDSEKEIIRRSVSRYLTDPATVRIIDLDYVHLHPLTLSGMYEMMALYNYEDWLQHHQEALYKNPIPTFTLFYPRIAPAGEVPEPDGVFNDPFMVVPLTLSEHITMHPVPTSWMSWNANVYDRLTTLPDTRRS